MYHGFTRRSEHVTTLDIVLTTIFGLFLLIMVMYFIRGFRVIRFRNRLHNQILAVSRQQVYQDPRTSWYWRVDYYNTVSYDAMLWRFWIPLKVDRWYKDDGFLH